MIEDVVAHVRGLDQIEQRTPEWYAVRQNMLTASDVAAAIGLNPYQTRKKLLEHKIFNNRQFTGNFATYHGNKHEDDARLLFGRLYNLDTWEVGLFRHLEYKWLGGSPDGIASDGSLIEIKCPVQRKIDHKIPEYYYPQVQLCMEILDIPQCYFIQYKPSGICNNAILDVCVIPRSKQWFSEQYPMLEQFWKDVLHYRSNQSEFKMPAKRTRKVKEVVPPSCMFLKNEDDSPLV